MPLIKKIALTFTILIFLNPSWATSLEGFWLSRDDKTHQKRALIQIEIKQGELTAKVARIYPQKGDTGICSACPGAWKNKPILGMTFAWGLKKLKHNTWGEGRIMDPKTGKIYRAKMTLSGHRLKVRGYIGFSLFGRSQIWQRVLQNEQVVAG